MNDEVTNEELTPAPPRPEASKKSGIVALVGRPNVGKSTLLNRFLGEEISIVTPKAQTTRDQVRGILNADPGQIVFVDTPGIHRAREGGINEYMLQEVTRALEGADAILYLVDPFSKPEAEERVLEYLKKASSRLVIVVNKVDAIKDSLKKNDFRTFTWLDEWIVRVRQELEGTKCIVDSELRISAEKGTGMNELIAKLYDLMPVGYPLYGEDDSLTDRSTRFVVAELIRKQLFMKLGDELPYSCAVEIESFDEKAKPVHIQAMIYVERESQKGMVIGAGGKKIKEIGTAARAEIEPLVGEKVYLELRVKVLEAWTSEGRKMKTLGYELERSRKKSHK
jgi:GTP-binding protein Era